MALPTLSALKSQKTSAAVTCVFGQNQEFEIPEACSKQCLIMSDHDQLHPADQPELHLRHHRLQLQQGEHRGGGTRGSRYVLIIHFYVESGQKMIQFNIQFKIESKIFIQ